MRVEGNDWKGWTEGLNDYYRDPEPGTIPVNHEFVFGDSDSPTKFKRREYRDAEFEEYDLMPTKKSTRPCVGLTDVERQLDLKDLPNDLDILPPPGLSAVKANECVTKLMPLAPPEAKAYYDRMTNKLREENRHRKEVNNKAQKQKK